MRKLLLSLILIVLVLGSVQAQDDTSTYISEDDAVQFSYPSDWILEFQVVVKY
ncbi:MAG: hypothetical protein Phog2KO_36110 [Phototrophicaceae bacterium]